MSKICSEGCNLDIISVKVNMYTENYVLNNKCTKTLYISLADLHTKFSGGRPLLRYPILSFSHTFSVKSALVGGPRNPPPQNGSTPLPHGKSWIRLSICRHYFYENPFQLNNQYKTYEICMRKLNLL